MEYNVTEDKFHGIHVRLAIVGFKIILIRINIHDCCYSHESEISVNKVVIFHKLFSLVSWEAT